MTQLVGQAAGIIKRKCMLFAEEAGRSIGENPQGWVVFLTICVCLQEDKTASQHMFRCPLYTQDCRRDLIILRDICVCNKW